MKVNKKLTEEISPFVDVAAFYCMQLKILEVIFAIHLGKRSL